MKVTIIPPDQENHNQGSDGQPKWLEDLRPHPVILNNTPNIGAYLTVLDDGQVCWCGPIAGGYWRYYSPFFKVDRRFKGDV